MRKTTSRIALVTGGSRGVGAGIAQALARSGARVALTYQTGVAQAAQVVANIESMGFVARAIPMTVEDRGSVRGAVEEIGEVFGPVNILVNNAAVGQEKPFETITDADWDHVLAVNLRGPFSCCQEVLPGMLHQGWGRIINIASIGGQWGGFNQVHYAAAKAGLVNLTRSLAKIFSHRGITANAVSPGLVRTDMSAGELESEAGREKVRTIPIGRIATVEEVASVVRFLASEEAGYVTGQTINVNGGMLF
ncbi:MAG: SDR family NAD(P)-dependent oxidoreductase [Acidobacteriota bacterium]